MRFFFFFFSFTSFSPSDEDASIEWCKGTDKIGHIKETTILDDDDSCENSILPVNKDLHMRPHPISQ